MRKWPLLCILFSGCMVGPRYHAPETVVSEAFTENQPDKTKVVTDEELLHWWKIFNDPFLDELLHTAISGNFDYRIALEQVAQARAYYWTQFAQILPEFDAGFLASQSRSNSGLGAAFGGAVTPITRSFYNIGLDAVWEIDLFGKLRHAANAAYDLWQASVDEVQAVKITVVSEVANIYATICATQKKLAIARQLVKVDEELLSLIRIRFDAGLANEDAVEGAIAALEADTASLSVIDTLLKQTIYSLAVLLGRLPETVMPEFTTERAIPQAAGKVPISLPSTLLRRRPDILASERQLAAATEEIGVAVAALFPDLNLTSGPIPINSLQGSGVGFASNRLSRLFDAKNFVYGVGGLVTMPVFDFGKRRAAVDVQVALKQQAYYTYQKTVILALQETEQALATYFNEEKRRDDLSKQVDANTRIFTLSTDRYQAGLVDYTQVLTAEQTYLLSMSTFVDSEQSLTTDLIALYKALGGNW